LNESIQAFCELIFLNEKKKLPIETFDPLIKTEKKWKKYFFIFSKTLHSLKKKY